MKYRQEIDGLRAFAVLSVVFFHAFPQLLPGGFIGVDVFFVISGYLITRIIFEQLDSQSFSFREFFSRRIRRIFPALILVMIATLIGGWYLLLADEYSQLGKHIANGSAFIINFTLVNEAGYFDTAAETKPMLHLWSLAVEEQFYIVWPLVLWFAWKRQYSLLKITVIVAFVSFLASVTYRNISPVEAFFWPVGRFWELLSGSILAWLTLYKKTELNSYKTTLNCYINQTQWGQRINSNGTLATNLTALAGFLLLIIGVTQISEDLSFPGFWALIPVSGAILIIVAGSSAGLNRIVFMNPIAVWFGLISYSLYLWHWPILAFLTIFEDGSIQYTARMFVVVLSILLAWLTYKFIEKPFRYGTREGLIAISLVLVLIVVGLSGYFIHSNQGIKDRYALFSVSPTNVDKFKKLSNAWDFSGYPNPDEMYQDPTTSLMRIGSNEVSKVLLIGDSHQEQYKYSFSSLPKGSKSILFKSMAFPPRIEDLPLDHTIDTIAISYFWAYQYGSTKVKQKLRCCGNGKNRTVGKVNIPYKSLEEMDHLDKALLDFIQDVQKRGLKVFVILDSPFGEELNPQSLIDRSFPFISLKPNVVLHKNIALERSEPVRSRLLRISSSLNVNVIDPIDFLCVNNECTMFSQTGELMYKDYDHISIFSSKNSVGYIHEILD